MSNRKSYTDELVRTLAVPAAILNVHGLVVSCNDSFNASLPEGEDCTAGQYLSSVLEAAGVGDLALRLDSDTVGHNSVMTSIELPAGRFQLSIDRLEVPGEEHIYLCQLTPDTEIDSSRLRFLLEHLDQGVWNYDILKERFAVTDAWKRMRGFPSSFKHNSTVNLDADWWLESIHIEDRPHLRRAFLSLVSGGKDDVNVQYRYQFGEDEWKWILCRAKVMSRNVDGRPIQLVGMDTDITSLKDDEFRQLEVVNKLQLAIDVSGMGVWEFDTATAHVFWDDKMLEIYGQADGANYRPNEVWEEYLHPDDCDEIVAAAEEALQERGDFRGDFRIVRPNGEIRYIRSAARHVASPGTRGKMLGVNQDVTEDYERAEELEIARQRLEYDSQHDALTGLANRRLLDEHIKTMQGRLDPTDEFAVLHIDLDHFKQVNDSLGHAAGDQVLVRVAETFRMLVGDDGLVCRNGGDEFVVLLESFEGERALRDLCQAMIDQVAEPMIIQGEMRRIGLSVGCAVSSASVNELSEVFINADVALYAAKSAGRSCFKVFSQGLCSMPRADVTSYHDIAGAIDSGQMHCVFQPQYDAHTLELTGAEALVRWDCPNRGLLLPQDFVPEAQATGLGRRLDEYVLDCVLDEQSSWARAGLEVFRVTLNVSLERFLEPGWVGNIEAKLKPHHAISFELLETAYLEERSDELDAALAKMRGAGIEFVLDDFGSGHSSIVALQTVKPDFVKMDRLLIAPLKENPAQIHILEALVRVARLERCRVIVEGIETQDQLDAVRGLDCDIVQGYLLGHPARGEDFIATLSHSHSHSDSRMRRKSRRA